MLSTERVFASFLILSQISLFLTPSLARTLIRRSLPQYMEYDNGYRPSVPPEKRTHVGKILPRGDGNDAVLQDITAFRGIGNDHNAFGGPTYTGEHYPFAVYSPEYGYKKETDFSFGKILTGLALWNLANEFNTYNNQDQYQRIKPQEHHVRESDNTSNSE